MINLTVVIFNVVIKWLINSLFYPNINFIRLLNFKLLNNLLKIKAFSVFQQTLTICKNHINNLYHQSSSVALSEWWIPQDKNSLFRPLKWDGYQPYYGKQRNSLKTGCEFYIEEGINWKPNKYLDIAIDDEYNEFQCCWIEIINHTNPNILVSLIIILMIPILIYI